jgi:hypothetical protein
VFGTSAILRATGGKMHSQQVRMIVQPEYKTRRQSTRKIKVKFQPFSNPTSKVRDVWSRFFTTLSSSAFISAYVVATSEASTLHSLLRVVGLCCFGVSWLMLAVYVFKGEK